MRPIFIGGCPRSGTTFLASLLGSHPDHLVTPETGFKASFLDAAAPASPIDGGAILERLGDTYSFGDWGLDASHHSPPEAPTGREFMEWLVRTWGEQRGKPAPSVWIDHSPSNVRDAHTLSRHFPDAKLVHIVRDGRAVAASFRGIETWGEKEIEPAARTWIEWIAHGFAAELSEEVLPVERVRYEDLVEDPGPVLESLCQRLELEYTPSMHDGTGFAVATRLNQTHRLVGRPPQRSRLDAWRAVLSQREVQRFEAVAKDLLYCLGYQPDFAGPAVPATTTERRISKVRGFARRRWVLARRRALGAVEQVRRQGGRQTSSSRA